MAKRLQKTDAQLSGILGGHKNIGSRLARDIEKRLGLPRGWLDAEYRDLTEEGAEVARWFQALTPEEKRAFRTIHKLPKK